HRARRRAPRPRAVRQRPSDREIAAEALTRLARVSARSPPSPAMREREGARAERGEGEGVCFYTACAGRISRKVRGAYQVWWRLRPNTRACAAPGRVMYWRSLLGSWR